MARRNGGYRHNVVVDLSQAVSGLSKIPGQMEKAVKATLSDMRTRGPAAISRGIAEEYNIKKTDIREAFRGARQPNALSLSLLYQGRRLTPIHFGMKPTTRPAPVRREKGDIYPITMEVKKGHRVRIETSRRSKGKGILFIARAGRNERTRAGKRMPSIPFMRTAEGGRLVNRGPIESFKAIAVPQMIQDKDGNTKPKVQHELDELMNKRFDHNIRRFFN